MSTLRQRPAPRENQTLNLRVLSGAKRSSVTCLYHPKTNRKIWKPWNKE